MTEKKLTVHYPGDCLPTMNAVDELWKTIPQQTTRSYRQRFTEDQKRQIALDSRRTKDIALSYNVSECTISCIRDTYRRKLIKQWRIDALGENDPNVNEPIRLCKSFRL